MRALGKHILLPTAIVAFVSFLDAGARAPERWLMLAGGGAVWLLFANSVNYGGMMLWHERWLLRQAVIPPWLLLAAAALVPIGLFAVHLSLVHLALLASALPRRAGGETLVAGGIAAASGFGAGIFAARLTELRPNFTLLLPKLLLASLVLTPVFYPVSALRGLEDAWCLANPLCVATELGRAGTLLQADALPRYAIPVASASSAAILCWGLLTLRPRSISFADEHV
jgi:ABC-type polysaccharide/polyol phosphate export permease